MWGSTKGLCSISLKERYRPVLVIHALKHQQAVMGFAHAPQPEIKSAFVYASACGVALRLLRTCFLLSTASTFAKRRCQRRSIEKSSCTVMVFFTFAGA